MAAAALAAVPGASERAVAAAAFEALIGSGSEYFGMEPFVASGPRAGTIHASWSDRVIGRDEGCCWRCRRPWALQRAADAHRLDRRTRGRSRRHGHRLRRRPDAALAHVRPGGSPVAAHAACKAAIADAGSRTPTASAAATRSASPSPRTGAKGTCCRWARTRRSCSRRAWWCTWCPPCASATARASACRRRS
ncbi:M24 family metallopeptidase [Streptomyces sp. M19]